MLLPGPLSSPGFGALLQSIRELDGPRSGMDRQIIGSIGPVYSSRIANLVVPLPCGVRV